MPNHVRHVFAAITLTLFAALGASSVAAQSNATISGTVADTSSAAIPGQISLRPPENPAIKCGSISPVVIFRSARRYRRSIHAGAQVVADGTDDAALRLSLVLRNDPGTGVVRHADAGYPEALDAARRHHLDLPSVAP